MFDEKTKQNLKAYVYMLIDPNENKPFYIGKGVDDRVFNHINCALTDINTSNVKYDTIREIKKNGGTVGHVIVRHGLTEDEAFQIEAALIDSFEFSGIMLSNKVGGHNSIEKGLMTSDEIKRLYNAEPLNVLPADCILININKRYRRGIGENAIFEATKGIWTINKNHLQDEQGNIKRKYVLSEYRGLIVEIFKVDRWYEQERGYNPSAKRFGQTRIGVAFDGTVAEEEVRRLFINKSIAHHKKQGQATAHRLKL
jgi:hypothetical protein